MATEAKKTYFQERMDLLGITDEENSLRVRNPEAEWPQSEWAWKPIFTEDKHGNIEILVYRVDGEIVMEEKIGEGKTSHLNAKYHPYKIKRLAKPITGKDGREAKYLFPKGCGSLPFFPPHLVKKFQDKTPIKTLFLTEGYFKSFKASMHGMDIVGLGSITHYRDKETGGLHSDILKLIETCSVQNVVWMVDGDCTRLSRKAYEETGDLYTRPFSFFSSMSQIQKMLDQYDIRKYFMHPLSDEYSELGNPKGLDDFLVAMKGREDEFVQDALALERRSKFFYRDEVTFSVGRIHRYFHLSNVEAFITYHANNYPKLLKEEFIFHGTRYKWNEEKRTCDIIVPADAKRYFRVGDEYYEHIEIPNKYGQLEKVIRRRKKGTILDDHGKKIIEHITRFYDFCVVPDHVNYQQVINGCYNLYAPFEHEASEDLECPHILEFMKHIFGNRNIHVRVHDQLYEINEFELGMDYVQLLYQQPQQALPILCLVSRENQTGKSTFAKFLKLLFTANTAIVGNAELANDFNASWASKLVIACDEAKIDKQTIVEKIKMHSTADKIFMNAKGKDHVEIDFFGKFILISNYEENFIGVGEEDIRYWVRKVPRLAKPVTNLLNMMKEEIPAFLNYMSKRKMKTECLSRAWFHENFIKTDALKKIIQSSRSTAEKEMLEYMRELFIITGANEILMAPNDVRYEVLRNKFELNYIRRILGDNMKLELWSQLEYQGSKFNSESELKDAFPNYEEEHLKRNQISRRYSYPRLSEGGGDPQWVSKVGRPFVFRRENFVTELELSMKPITDAMPAPPEHETAPGIHTASQDPSLPF